MSNESNSSVAAQKKPPRKQHKAHGGAWKVAYADLVTALMALFIVLWVLNQDQTVISSVSQYFKDPSGKQFNIEGTSEGDSGSSTIIVEQELSMDKLETVKLQQMGEDLLRELSENAELRDLIDQIKVEMVDEGLRIEIVESAKDVFFEVGTAKLKENARLLLQKIGGRLTESPYQIVIEGHTDSRPYPDSATGYTNFELSVDRANSARRALIFGGFRKDKIDEIRGYADRRLRETSDPFSVINRRISIIVRYPENDEADDL